MTATRIYLVKDSETGGKRLIRASNVAQAVRHAARAQFTAEVASQDDLVFLIADGHSVEDASAATEEQPALDLAPEPQA